LLPPSAKTERNPATLPNTTDFPSVAQFPLRPSTLCKHWRMPHAKT